MLNLVVVSDSHLTRQTPARRTDADYAETLFRKLEAVHSFAVEVQASAILHAGDVGDHVEWSFRTFNRLYGLITGKWIAVPGQHDLYGHRPESLEDAPLGTLQLAEVVSVLQYGDSVYVGSPAAPPVVNIVGYGWGDRDIDAVLRGERPWLGPKDMEEPTLLMMHCGLAPEAGHGVDCTVADARCSGVSLVVSGHWHRGFVSEPVGGVVYASPGALARAAITDRDRPPLMLHVTVWENNEERLAVEKTSLPDVYGGVEQVHAHHTSRVWEGQCGTVWGATLWVVPHEPPDKVFDLNEWEQKERVDAQEYLAALQRAQELRDEDEPARVRRIGEAAGFGEPSIACVIEHLPDNENGGKR